MHEGYEDWNSNRVLKEVQLKKKKIIEEAAALRMRLGASKSEETPAGNILLLVMYKTHVNYYLILDRSTSGKTKSRKRDKKGERFLSLCQFILMLYRFR